MELRGCSALVAGDDIAVIRASSHQVDVEAISQRTTRVGASNAVAACIEPRAEQTDAEEGRADRQQAT